MLNEKNAFSNFALAALLGASPLAGTAAYQYHPRQANDNAQSISQPIAKSKVHDEATLKRKNIIARTLWAEARNDGKVGMTAVASVIYNRANGNIENVIPVIKRKKQFSCWNAMTESDWTNFQIKEKTGPEWAEANQIAEEMVTGTFKPTTTANHYYNPTKCSPSWANNENGELREFAVIGSHRFMDI